MDGESESDGVGKDAAKLHVEAALPGAESPHGRRDVETNHRESPCSKMLRVASCSLDVLRGWDAACCASLGRCLLALDSAGVCVKATKTKKLKVTAFEGGLKPKSESVSPCSL